MTTPADALTRGQVAAVLGVGPTTVRRLEERGSLHPTRDERGARRFDPHEVEQVRAARAEAGVEAPEDEDVADTEQEPEQVPDLPSDHQVVVARVAELEFHIGVMFLQLRELAHRVAQLPRFDPFPCVVCGRVASPRYALVMRCCGHRF